MAKTWLQYGSSNWILLNLNCCAQGFSMANFTLLHVSCNPKNMALYSPNMVLTWCFNLVVPESQQMCPGMFHFKFLNCWVYYLAPPNFLGKGIKQMLKVTCLFWGHNSPIIFYPFISSCPISQNCTQLSRDLILYQRYSQE